MTTTPTAPEASGFEGRRAQDLRRPRRWNYFLVVVVAAVTVGAGAGLWWWLHPGDPFGPAGNLQEQTQGRVGTTYFFDAGIYADRPVVVSQVTAVLDPQSALAAVAVVACAPSQPHTTGVTSLQCQRPRQVRTTRLTGNDIQSPYFVVAVTPLTPGLVKIDGFRVSYEERTSHSARTGTITEVDARA